MTIQVFPDYLSKLYYILHVMSDEELDNFYINDIDCRTKLFAAMKAEFDRFGPISKKRTLEAIEFILFSDDIQKYWRAVVPQEIPLDEVDDKVAYLRTLYQQLAGRAPLEESFDPDVELVYGRAGIDVRL